MKRFASFVALIAVLTVTTYAQKGTALNLGKDNLALAGYDPIAYFKDKKAVEGNPSITTLHEGVRYQFASQAHKDLFLASPAAYLPQYGGWCAYAMGAKGEKVEVDPETFKILDGKLYLFYNKYFNNTLEKWNDDETALKMKADTNWTKLAAH